MAYCDHDPALLAAVARGFDRHVHCTDGYAELDGAAFAADLRAAGWEATWTGSDDEEFDVAYEVSSAWGECAEPCGEEDDGGERQVSAAPHEVLDNLAVTRVTFTRVSA